MDDLRLHGLIGGGTKRNGDNAALSSEVAGTTLKLVPPKGTYDGVTSKVTITDADFLAIYIKKNINLFGILGSLNTFTNIATGQSNAVAQNQKITVSGLAFKPDIVVFYVDDSSYPYYSHAGVLLEPAYRGYGAGYKGFKQGAGNGYTPSSISSLISTSSTADRINTDGFETTVTVDLTANSSQNRLLKWIAIKI